MSTTEAPQQEPTHYVEWTGRIKVHQPIRPTVHETAREFKVACA